MLQGLRPSCEPDTYWKINHAVHLRNPPSSMPPWHAAPAPNPGIAAYSTHSMLLLS